MELYRGLPTEISFNVPAGSVQHRVGFFRGTTQVGFYLEPTVVGGVATFTPSYEVVSIEGEVQAQVSFSIDFAEYTETHYFDVVTPYLSPLEVRDIVGADKTDAEVMEAERAARLVINNHCGQSFGYAFKTLRVRGKADNPLILPERLDVFTSAANEEWGETALTEGFILKQDGYALARPGIFDWDSDGIEKGVIRPPSLYRARPFDENSFYDITGWWGWRRVPTPVIEAARLLVGDYDCDDGIYRDRYIMSVSASDWRYAFHSGTFERTGNLRADQLLSDYVRLGWSVV